MNKLSDFLSNQDMFGYQITFTFNEKGNIHNTPCGGFASILVKIVFFAFALTNFLKMHNFEDNKIVTNIETDKEGTSIAYKQMDLIFGLNLYRQIDGFLKAIDYDNDLKRYINIFYE